jgi:spoIIIJ-associated protein
MEWVETTGRTVAAALDVAMDELGVDEDEVEYDVLEEPKSGLFGRIGASPARVRARVKPLSREKPGDRNRVRSGRPGGPNRRRSGGRSGSGGGAAAGSPQTPSGDGPGASAAAVPTRSDDGPGDGSAGGTASKRRRRRGGSGGGSTSSTAHGPRTQKEDEEHDVTTTTTEDVPIGEQADVADEFTRGLVSAFGLTAEVAVRIDDDVVLVDVEGEDLGLLVGPKGATLRAVEDLVRTVVQRRTDGQGARIHVDVGGYQAKRRAALEKFARELAGRVAASGEELALEPMSASDRKVVHDTVAQIDGVNTVSEGEDPRRRVVLRPE